MIAMGQKQVENFEMLAKRLRAKTLACHSASHPEYEPGMVPESAPAVQHRTACSRTMPAVLIAILAFAAKAHAQIVAFGASNMSGAHVAASAAIPAQLQLMLQEKGYAVTVLNAGVAGNTTADMRARIDRDIPQKTTIVILDTSGGLYGDTQRGISRAQGAANLAAIRTTLAARHIKVIPFNAAFIPPQYRQSDGVNLTPQGHRLAASNLMVAVVQALGPAPAAPQSLGEKRKVVRH